jgi:hypothetical protein
MAFGYEDGILYDWMVAEPEVLLLGDIGRRARMCRVDELGWSGTV